MIKVIAHSPCQMKSHFFSGVAGIQQAKCQPGTRVIGIFLCLKRFSINRYQVTIILLICLKLIQKGADS